MKKMVAMIAVMIVVLTAMVTANAEFYSEFFQIVSHDEATDMVTVRTCTGNEFQFEGLEDLCIGDFLTAVMDDNGTPEVFDDMIVSIHYQRPDMFLEMYEGIEYENEQLKNENEFLNMMIDDLLEELDEYEDDID